jgi:flavin prenyltransferase
MGMVVGPCSIRTVGEIASSATSNLLTRAKDVCLKERRRRLVLMVRETPLHAGHLRAMLAATEAGAVMFPPVPAFYAKPQSLAEMGTTRHSRRARFGQGRVRDIAPQATPDRRSRWRAA